MATLTSDSIQAGSNDGLNFDVDNGTPAHSLKTRTRASIRNRYTGVTGIIASP
jgi:hypothetical protein